MTPSDCGQLEWHSCGGNLAGGYGGGFGFGGGGKRGGGGGGGFGGGRGGRDGGWPAQTTPASSACESDSATPHPLKRQSASRDSLPVHATLSIQIWPVPSPYAAQQGASVAPGYPSWRHTTLASSTPQLSSVTVPHCPAWYTSMRPTPGTGLSARRTEPSMSGGEGGGGGGGGDGCGDGGGVGDGGGEGGGGGSRG